MYPTIYHIFLDWFGVEIGIFKFLNSFGFFVALAFIAASWTLGRELKRKENEGLLQPTKLKRLVGLPPKPLDMAVQGLIGFVIGWKALYIAMNFAEATADPQAMLLSGKGDFLGGLLLGAALAFWKYREQKKLQLSEPVEEEVEMHPWEHAGNITLTAALFGILGAKFFHLLENPDELVQFFTDPSKGDFFSGLTMYGGLIVGGTAVIWSFKRKGIKPLMGMDATAPGLMLAYAVGRIGCHVSGDGDWGIVNTAPKPSWLPDWLWAYDYPNNVLGRGVPLEDGTIFEGYGTHLVPPVFPTPLYEVIMCGLLFLVLWKVRSKLKVPGTLFCLYLIFNGFERFWIEKIRINEHLIGTITQAEVIAVALMLTGGIGWWLLKRKARHAV